jgi:hypothetical protein
MRKIISSLLFSCFTAAVVFANGPYPGGGGGGTSGTNFAGILVTNSIISTNITTATSDLTLSQTGDSFGKTAIHLQNRNGVNGAQIENNGLNLSDIAFKASSGTVGTIRFESRGSGGSDLRSTLNYTNELQVFIGTIGLFGIGTNNATFVVPEYAPSFTATTTGQTNVFDVTLFTNGVNAYVSSIDTNTAQIYGGLTNLVLNTIYTNANQRALLVGSIYAICTSTLDAGAVIYYTNNGVAQNLSIIAAHHSATPGTNWIPFTVPLGPSATYRIQTNGIGTCYPTNVFLWRL